MVLPDSRETAATPDLRVQGASRGLQDNLEKLARGVDLEQMGAVECLESQVERGTEALTDCPAFQERRGTGESLALLDPLVLPERTDREVRTERSGHGDWLERAVQEVF